MFGGVQVTVFEPKPGRFPDAPPPEDEPGLLMTEAVSRSPRRMGVGAGGRITQKIYPDPYGMDVWDPDNTGSVSVHLVNSDQYRDITGDDPPPSPIDAGTYTSHGLPWFALYDERRGDVAPSQRLADVESTGARDARLDPRAPLDASVDINDDHIRKLGTPNRDH